MSQSSNLYLELMEEDNRDVFREDQREQDRKTAYLESKDEAIETLKIQDHVLQAKERGAGIF